MNIRFPTLASQSLNTAECLETELVLDLILSFSKGILDKKKSDIGIVLSHCKYFWNHASEAGANFSLS